MTAISSIENWWQKNPMTYGATHGQTAFEGEAFEIGSRAFYDRLDQEFYSWNKPLHGKEPFDRLFPYEQFRGRKVLEVGCGLGTMLMNWAQHGAECHGVDLNSTSIEQTRNRFALLGLKGEINKADARQLPFTDSSFDYVYSWGVLHHSPDLPGSLAEFFRVLRPQGSFGIMLYNRQSFLQWYVNDFIEGYLHQEKRWLDPLEFNSRYGDGHREEGNPHTWPVTKKEILRMVSPYAADSQVKVLGTDLDSSLRLMLPVVGRYLPKPLVKALARRWGWSLWITGQKDG